MENGHQKLRALPVQLIEVDGGAILKRGCAEVLFRGERAAEVLHHVLAACSRQDLAAHEICALFAAPDRPAVQHVVEQLTARRLLVPIEGTLSSTGAVESHLDVFYWHFAEAHEHASERLSRLNIAILGVNWISRQLVRALHAGNMQAFTLVDYPLLRNQGLFDEQGEFLPEEWPPSSTPIAYREWIEHAELRSLDCIVATSDFGAGQVFREWNRFCVQHNRLFFPIVLRNMVGHIGPMVIPGETACYECLEARQNANTENFHIVRAVEDAAFEGQKVNGFLPSMASILGDLAAIELTKFCSDSLPKTKPGMFIEVNLLATKLKSHKVLKIPRCPVCSPLATRSSAIPIKGEFVQTIPPSP